MRIAIQGTDYSDALDAAIAMTIERKLNAATLCEFALSFAAAAPPRVPARFDTVRISSDSGVLLFTGFIAAVPFPVFVGMAIFGPAYRYIVQAMSDEILLDQALMAISSGATGQSAGVVLQSLTNRTGLTRLNTSNLALAAMISHYAPAKGASWSQSSAQVALQARASYRALNGSLSMNQVATTVHDLNQADGTLNLEALRFSSSLQRAIANDVTVCGQIEPGAYVTEYFRGDGVTTEFYLADKPFLPRPAQQILLSDSFDEATIDTRVWGVTGGQGYLALSAEGLALKGGSGVDGQVHLHWLDPVEMGGTLLLEARGVRLAPGSSGVLAGFYSGSIQRAACAAGFSVSSISGGGAVSVQPLLSGSAAGSSYTLNSANLYTLRMRLHASEVIRVHALYHAVCDQGEVDSGGDWVLASAQVQMEIQEYVNGVGGMPVTLYDGTLDTLPGSCSVVAVSSVNLIGSLRSVTLANLGSVWVRSTPPGGAAYSRRLGSSTSASECCMSSTGVLTFFTGSTPALGELVAVSYRTQWRSVGRAVNVASQAALAAAGSPSICSWIGTVTAPETRTSADCRNAALALEQMASSESALWRGTYAATNFTLDADVWPGDALRLRAPSLSLDTQVIVRAVTLRYRASVPDVVEYSMAFANEWAEDLAIHTSAVVPDDAWLPAQISPTLLASPSALAVTQVSGSSVGVSVGLTPPAGGGFEVRRRDHAFMAGQDTDLVLRTSVSSFTFARESAQDRFYIRMYDGSTPPNYSEFSAALFLNLPLGS